MEKRKIDINYDNSDEQDNQNDKYTFILPNEKYKDITIVSKKNQNDDSQEANSK